MTIMAYSVQCADWNFWAERGGGGTVRADRASPGVWGRFKVTHIR